MKTSFALAILSAIGAAQAASTVTCSAGCPSSPTVDDIVTRSDAPVSSCTDAKLTAVYNSDHTMTTSLVTPGVPGEDGGEGAQPTPTGVPTVPEGAAGKLLGGTGAVMAAAIVAVCMV